MTPSSEMNSVTTIRPMMSSSVRPVARTTGAAARENSSAQVDFIPQG
jgi:hypothetical protein